jgi:hypothetical protein
MSSSSVFHNDNKMASDLLILKSSNSVRNGGGGCCCCCCCKCCCRCKCVYHNDLDVGGGFNMGRARSESQCEYSPQERNDAQVLKDNYFTWNSFTFLTKSLVVPKRLVTRWLGKENVLRNGDPLAYLFYFKSNQIHFFA